MGDARHDAKKELRLFLSSNLDNLDVQAEVLDIYMDWIEDNFKTGEIRKHLTYLKLIKEGK